MEGRGSTAPREQVVGGVEEERGVAVDIVGLGGGLASREQASEGSEVVIGQCSAVMKSQYSQFLVYQTFRISVVLPLLRPAAPSVRQIHRVTEYVSMRVYEYASIRVCECF